MYNVKEKEFREIERVQEDLLRKYFNTLKGCPIYMLKKLFLVMCFKCDQKKSGYQETENITRSV